MNKRTVHRVQELNALVPAAFLETLLELRRLRGAATEVADQVFLDARIREMVRAWDAFARAKYHVRHGASVDEASDLHAGRAPPD